MSSMALAPAVSLNGTSDTVPEAFLLGTDLVSGTVWQMELCWEFLEEKTLILAGGHDLTPWEGLRRWSLYAAAGDGGSNIQALLALPVSTPVHAGRVRRLLHVMTHACLHHTPVRHVEPCSTPTVRGS